MPDIKKYKIVLGRDAQYNEVRAANFLLSNIKLVTGYKPDVVTDDAEPYPYEIVVGKTDRELSDGVEFVRSDKKRYQYEIRYVVERLYLTGLGIPHDYDPVPFAAYGYINDGAQGTAFAAYHFVEDTLGYDFVDHANICDTVEKENIEINENCNFVHTSEKIYNETPKLYDGAALYSVPGGTTVEGWGMSCFIFKTKSGKLIVHDGGFEEDAEHLVRVLETLSGGKKPVVSAWLLSHLHAGHAGAYKAIAQNKELSARITVENFYGCILSEDFYFRPISQRRRPAAKELRDTVLASEETMGVKLNTVKAGDKIAVDEFVIEVLRSPEALDEVAGVSVNDSTVVYKLTFDGKQTMILLGDGEQRTSDELLSLGADALKCDILQVGHHGAPNVAKKCYLDMNASVYIWQTDDRHWYGDDGDGVNSWPGVTPTRTRQYVYDLVASKENIYRDTYGILSFELPIKVK